jgi:hypothetical protein
LGLKAALVKVKIFRNVMTTSKMTCLYNQCHGMGHATNLPFSGKPVLLENFGGQVALEEVSVPVLLTVPVSIIPPLLHTHSFIYSRRCIIFSSIALQPNLDIVLLNLPPPRPSPILAF